MKRTTNDVIDATVKSYLKCRHYQDTELVNSEQSICQTSKEATVTASIECGMSRDNSIVFSAIVSDALVAEQAYQKFKNWINDIQNEQLNNELKRLLYPIFCHLYLEMLRVGDRQAAVQFFKSNQHEFVTDQEKKFIDDLAGMYSIQDIDNRGSVNNFRNRKYKVELSDVAHVCLQQFLTKHGHIILMQIINTYVTVIKTMDQDQSDKDEEKGILKKGLRCDSGTNGHVEQQSGTGVDREMRELQEAIRMIRNNAKQTLRIFKVNNAHERATCGTIANEMDKLSVGFSTGELRLWGINETVFIIPDRSNLRTNDHLFESPFANLHETNCSVDEAGAVTLRGHTDVVHDIKFIEKSQVLLSVSSDCDMRAWRLKDVTCGAVYTGHTCPIWCMDKSAFNLYIATGSHDRTAKLWSLDRKFPLRIFAGHFLDVNSIKFHPNARYLATGSTDKTVRLWSKDDGNMLRVYVGSHSTIYSLAFSPDGKYLASAGDDKCIYVWDLATNALLTSLRGFQDTVVNLDWSSDGQYIVGASVDGSIRIWLTQDCLKLGNDGANETQDFQLKPHQIYSTQCSSILSVGFSGLNNFLVCLGTSKNV